MLERKYFKKIITFYESVMNLIQIEIDIEPTLFKIFFILQKFDIYKYIVNK